MPKVLQIVDFLTGRVTLNLYGRSELRLTVCLSLLSEELILDKEIHDKPKQEHISSVLGQAAAASTPFPAKQLDLVRTGR